MIKIGVSLVASQKELSAISKKQLAVRDLHWPHADGWLWDRRAHKGFTTIPKTFPVILKIMDEMTKGAPVSSTFLTLWCHTWDNSFVALSKQAEMANAAGFGGQRGEHTWVTRVRKLCDLKFIDVKAGKSGPLSNAIIWNPHLVIRWHYHIKTPGLTEQSYNSLLETALDIGALDMTRPWTPSVPGQMAQNLPPRKSINAIEKMENLVAGNGTEQ